MLATVLASALALTGPTASAAVPAASSAPRTADAHRTVDDAFAAASKESGVPRDLLVAVGYGETHLDGHGGEPSSAGGYGIMHLVSNPERKTLEQAAKLTGLPETELRRDPAANIRGGAAVLRAHADELGLDAADRERVGAWYPAVARYSGTGQRPTARLYADTVYDFLASGIRAKTPDGERVTVKPRETEPERGPYAGVRSLDPSTGDEPEASGVGMSSTDYGPAHWVPAHGNNYQPGRSAAIDKVVIHVTQGSYAGSISWFQNASSGVSSHYVIRSGDGDITQMVRDADTAYHARSANPSSLGIEHEGYVSDASWFTDAMYRSSAALTRHLCDTHGIPKTRAHILGHNELPGNDHTDPGPNWNWDYYMQLVTSGGGAKKLAGSPTDFTGDGKDDIVTFTQNAEADVYVASAGEGGFGDSRVWQERFAPGGETPLSGDFNGDGVDDIVTFTREASPKVWVALSDGERFGAAEVWHEFFSLRGEVPAVGDVNGDGFDDIVSFTHDDEADVWVALNTGDGRFGAAEVWHDFFGPAGEFPALGDVDGDGMDDLITFTQGAEADVYVALSNGDGFGASRVWHGHFAVGGEQPRVGDVDGDGRDDIVTFTQGDRGDVYVARSAGGEFGAGELWHEWFSPAGEFPYLGDYDGDGMDDIVSFTR
ncbi:N-acetylmuramoyl-L-alanine amidase, partial [Streptomyces lycii]